MRLKNCNVIILLVSFFFITACFQLKPDKPIDLPSTVLERAVLCGKITVKEDWADPSDEKSVFIKGQDTRIYSFLSFKNVREEHSLVWKWYDPYNRVYRSTDKIKIGKGKKHFEKYIAWDNIFLFQEKEVGKWRVAIFLDDVLLETIEFEIK